MKPLPSADELRKLLDYDHATGKLFWKRRPQEMFSTSHPGQRQRADLWNKRFAGKEAFTASGTFGYKVGAIHGNLYAAHRVAFAVVNGYAPDTDIDHINGDRTDNRMDNLRVVDRAENMRNAKIPKDNKSGVIGVNWDKERGKWYASIQVDGKTKSLGRHMTLEAAAHARKQAEIKYGYHANHGRAN